MKWIAALALALSAALSGVAEAQTAQTQAPAAYVAGIYDGRAIAGWQFAAEFSRDAPLWVPNDAPREGSNCNVLVAPVAISRDQWLVEFNNFTAEMYAQRYAAANVEVLRSDRTVLITLQDRPALQYSAGVRAGDRELEMLTVSVSGSQHLITITCTVVASRFAARRAQVEGFIQGLILLEPPPQ